MSAQKIRITRGLYNTTADQKELDVESALAVINYWHDSYEITSRINRPYGDVDFKNTPFTSEVQFNEQDALIGKALFETCAAASQKFSIMKSSSYNYKKISWRFVLKGWKGTMAAIKSYMKDLDPVFQDNQRKLGVIHPQSLDLSIYNPNRKMRMLYSSKDGEDRPLQLVHGDPVDTLISYIPSDMPHKDLPEPEMEESATSVPASVTSRKYTFEECEALMDALLVDRSWVNTYEGARNTIWAFWQTEQSERMLTLLKRIARSGAPHNDDVKFIHETTRTYRATSNPITLATVYWKVKELNPAGFADLRQRFKRTYFHEIVGYERPDWPVYENWQNATGYLKPLPYTEHATLLVDSHLGTGKTTAMKQIVDANLDKRIILITARRTFTASMFAEWGQAAGFINYRDVAGSLNQHAKVFVQVESLWRLFEQDEITPFDIVLMDEVESILAQCSPSPTHQGNYLANMAAFERVVHSGSRLIAMDAFVTERSIEVLEALRTDIALVHNPFQPYKRTAIKTPCNNNREGKSLFWKAVLEAVKSGKRVCVPCGSQNQGLAFEKILKAHGISYLFYHSTDDRQSRKQTLQDVNTSWADVQVLLYTPSITIGINYDNKAAPFDRMFLYGSAAGGIPRDMFQGSLRARVIKDDVMVYCLDKRAIHPSVLGMEDIEAQHQFNTACTSSLMKAVEVDTTKLHSLPEWNKRLIYRNTNEKNVSIVESEAVYNWFLDKCGYTVVEQNFTEAVEYSNGELPPYSTVKHITTQKASVLEDRKRKELPISEEEQHSLSAHYLKQAVPHFENIDVAHQEVLWVHWHDKIQRNYILNVMSERFSAKQLLRSELRKASKCVDLVSTKPQRQDFIKTLLSILDGRTSLSASEVTEIVPDLETIFKGGVPLKLFGIRERASKCDTALYYIHKVAEILAKWDGSEVKAIEERKQTNGKRVRMYSLDIAPRHREKMSSN